MMSSNDKIKEHATPKSLAPPRDYPIVSGGTVVRMLFFTLLMVTLPISSYFISKFWVFEGYLELSQDQSIIPSAVTAVVMVHIVLGLFIYAAYTEDIPKKSKQA